MYYNDTNNDTSQHIKNSKNRIGRATRLNLRKQVDSVVDNCSNLILVHLDSLRFQVRLRSQEYTR